MIHFTRILAITALMLSAAQAHGLSIDDPGQGLVTLGPTAGAELSGLTYVGGNQYLAVGDSGGKLYNVTIDLNTATGQITGTPALGSSVVLAGSTDLEDLAYDPTDSTVVVADETGPRVARYQLDGTQVGGDLTIPAVYADARGNLALESIARRDNGDLWIANEEALFKAGGTNDGPKATQQQGTAVRITNLASGKQWAYVTEPSNGPFTIPFTDKTVEKSGLVSLLVLPDGKVLALERVAGPGFTSRIFELDFSGATDVSSITDLDDDGDDQLNDEAWTAVDKTMLWETTQLQTNFEGMALGPQLDNGDHALILVSDDNGGGLLKQNLYVVHLEGDIPEPGTLAMLGAMGVWLLKRRRRLVPRHAIFFGCH